MALRERPASVLGRLPLGAWLVDPLGGLGGDDRAAQVARLDDLLFAVAIFPAELDLDLVALASEAEDDVVAGAGEGDGFDLGPGRRQRGQREHLAQVPAELIAEVGDRP